MQKFGDKLIKDAEKLKGKPLKKKAHGGVIKGYAEGGSTNGPLHRGWGKAIKGTKFKGIK